MNKVIIAAAGSGKTQEIVRQALSVQNNVLITTFTDQNVEEICQRIYKENGCIPPNVVVIPWYTFVLKYFVKPYQDIFYKDKIKNILMVEGQSTRGVSVNNVGFYFTKDNLIYSDKISQFALKCLAYYKDAPLSNFSRIFQTIFIDEVQDMAGYDLELIKKFMLCHYFDVLCVGDPRQGVYFTSQGRKNQKFKRAGLVDFFQKPRGEVVIDESSLNVNHRCPPEICQLSDRLYPSLPSVSSDCNLVDAHRGAFFVRTKDVKVYLAQYQPMQLVSSKATKREKDYGSMNFGQSKGRSFDRVLIYPSSKMLDILLKNKGEEPKVRANLYVALTRARISAGIVYDYSEDETWEGIEKYHAQAL